MISLVRGSVTYILFVNTSGRQDCCGGYSVAAVVIYTCSSVFSTDELTAVKSLRGYWISRWLAVYHVTWYVYTPATLVTSQAHYHKQCHINRSWWRRIVLVWLSLTVRHKRFEFVSVFREQLAEWGFVVDRNWCHSETESVLLTLFVYLKLFTVYWTFSLFAGISVLMAKFWGFSKMVHESEHYENHLWLCWNLLDQNFVLWDIARWNRSIGSVCGPSEEK